MFFNAASLIVVLVLQLRSGAPLTRIPSDKLKAASPPFLPPSYFEPWNSDRSHFPREAKSEPPRLPMPPQRKLNSSGNSDIVSVCEDILPVCWSFCFIYSCCPLLCFRRPSLEWWTGPLSSPASPKDPRHPPPLTLVTIIPLIPLEAQTEWQGSTAQVSSKT